MKLSLKILKAINKGLNEALSDLIDNEDDDSLYTSRSHSISLYASLHKNDLIWIQDNFVDLGLPSGTLWCKYNLGATCKNTKKSWYGDYYMWGSTKPNTKDNCCWENAPFNNGNSELDKDYFNLNMSKFIDRNNYLLLDYDSAYQTNHLMRIPTRELLEELIDLPIKWIENYNNIKDLNGIVFIGKNGNKLFVPTAGYRTGNSILSPTSAFLWSLNFSRFSPYNAYSIYNNTINTGSERCRGFNIRPVIY